MKPVFGVALALIASVPVFTSQARDDTKDIQGLWAPTSAVLGSQPMADAMVKSITLTLENGKYEVSVGGNPDNGTYIIDPTTTPKSMSVTGTEGPNTGRTFPAIYELKGDTLRTRRARHEGRTPNTTAEGDLPTARSSAAVAVPCT